MGGGGEACQLSVSTHYFMTNRSSLYPSSIHHHAIFANANKLTNLLNSSRCWGDGLSDIRCSLYLLSHIVWLPVGLTWGYCVSGGIYLYNISIIMTKMLTLEGGVGEKWAFVKARVGKRVYCHCQWHHCQCHCTGSGTGSASGTGSGSATAVVPIKITSYIIYI